MDKKKLLNAINEWQCTGYFGYGQGRAAAEFKDLGEEPVCHDVCPRSLKCRKRHCERMDTRFPEVADIVKRTLAECQGTEVPIIEAVVWAMSLAAQRDNLEARKIQEGLKRFKVPVITDHYIYGQLENLDNGLNKKDPKTPPLLILVGAKVK